MGLFRHHNQMPPRIKRKLKQRLLLAFVQPFGPWLYFAFGQER
ncbi:hypothetical protein [Lactiplantibacillus plantarum]|nr:hypothetical protein [Lactiplantibacillus plantarum]